MEKKQTHPPLGETIAEPEGCASSPYLADISPRHRKWDQRKRDSLTAAGIIGSRHPKKGARIAECCNDIALRWSVTPSGERVAKVTGTHRCMNPKVCDVCAAVKTNRWRRELQTVLPRLMQEHPTYRFVFLTLTVRNCAVTELRTTLKGMAEGWARLMKCPDTQVVKGFLRGTEVTRGKDGSAHPHFHALLVVPSRYFTAEYISHARWVAMWKQVARLAYDPIVNVKAVKHMEGMLEEVLKIAAYSVKKSEVLADPEWFRDFHDETLGLRFTNTGGLIKQYLKGDLAAIPADEDMAEIEAPPEAVETGETAIFGFHPVEHRYKQTRVIIRPP